MCCNNLAYSYVSRTAYKVESMSNRLSVYRPLQIVPFSVGFASFEECPLNFAIQFDSQFNTIIPRTAITGLKPFASLLVIMMIWLAHIATPVALADMRAYIRWWAARTSSGCRLILAGIRHALSNPQRTLLLGVAILYQIPMVLALPVDSRDKPTDIAMESYKLAQTSYKTTVAMGVVMVALAITSTAIAIAQFLARRRDELANNEAGVTAAFDTLQHHIRKNR
ncbi:hypothetical protein F4680DRAFT_424771 [Xylaria scruposa]|nr:hypothetical protein F4680DRAFT_424771 [Xylaria scruposa]